MKEFKPAKDIKPDKTLTADEKALKYKMIHGEATIPASKDEKVAIKERFRDTEVDVETRLNHLERVMKDALTNMEDTQAIFDEAKKEYEALRKL